MPHGGDNPNRSDHLFLLSTTRWPLLVDADRTIAQLAEPAKSPRDAPANGDRRSERTFARRNSSTNCLISHSPRTQRLVKEAVRDAGRPGRGSSPRSSRLAPDGHLRGRLASGPAARLAGPGRHGRVGPLARVRQRWSRRSAMSPCWGTTSTLSGWPTRWPTRHAGVCSRPPWAIG